LECAALGSEHVLAGLAREVLPVLEHRLESAALAIHSLLGFTLAAYNLDRIRSFKAKHGLDDSGQVVAKPQQQRARRRTGTWTEVIETSQAPHRLKHQAVADQQADPLQVGFSASRTGP
jgi:hypothetical protein